MSRNMIEANQAIFSLIDRYCFLKQDSISNAGAPRWIKTTSKEQRDFLKLSTPIARLPFSSRRQLARFDFSGKAYFLTFGFEHLHDFSDLDECDLDPGLITVALSELCPTPVASTLEIRNIVEAMDKHSFGGYSGHESIDILALFPTLKTFVREDLTHDDSLKVFFLLCLHECRNSDSWINDRLADELIAFADLDPGRIPYQTLCRSIFDVDPSAFFLALYRCLEALYAFSSAQKLIASLGLVASWEQVAMALEDELGWYPREENSLGALLDSAVDSDLQKVIGALGDSLPAASGGLSPIAGKRIYKLRNSLVHYRPTHQGISYDNVDWNRLCTAMAAIVLDVYWHVFGP